MSRRRHSKALVPVDSRNEGRYRFAFAAFVSQHIERHSMGFSRGSFRRAGEIIDRRFVDRAG